MTAPALPQQPTQGIDLVDSLRDALRRYEAGDADAVADIVHYARFALGGLAQYLASGQPLPALFTAPQVVLTTSDSDGNPVEHATEFEVDTDGNYTAVLPEALDPAHRAAAATAVPTAPIEDEDGNWALFDSATSTRAGAVQASISTPDLVTPPVLGMQDAVAPDASAAPDAHVAPKVTQVGTSLLVPPTPPANFVAPTCDPQATPARSRVLTPINPYARPGLSPGMALGAAQDWLDGRLDQGDTCPCCGQMAKIYRRTINAGIATSLIKMFKASGGDGTAWIHLPSQIGSKSREEGKARYWDLVEEEVDFRREDGGRAGYWRLTPKGVDFVMGMISIPKYTYVYNGTRLWQDGEPIAITDVRGEKFNYNELMGYSLTT